MVEALDGFDPKTTYDEGAWDYEDASRDFWQYLSRRTVDRLGLQPGERVLDVPCGTGPSLLPAAERVGPSGRVLGLDLAENMLQITRDKIRARGLTNIDLAAGDMTAIDRPAEPFDAVVCVLGIFFVGDMPALVRSFSDLVRPGGGRVAVTVFGERFFDPMRDVFVEAVHGVAPGFHVIEPWRRTDQLSVFRGIFDEAGVDVAIETDDDRLPLPTAQDWWRIVMGSGLRRTVVALDQEAAAEVRARCDAHILEHHVDELVTRSRYAIAVRR